VVAARLYNPSTTGRIRLLDLDRIERMVLRNVAGDFFRIPLDPTEGGEH